MSNDRKPAPYAKLVDANVNEQMKRASAIACEEIGIMRRLARDHRRTEAETKLDRALALIEEATPHP